MAYQGSRKARMQYWLQDADGTSAQVTNDSLFARLAAIDGTIGDFNDNTDSLEAIADAVAVISTEAMRGTDSAALASIWSSALATAIGTTNTTVASGTYGLSALKTLIDAIPTTMRGTDSAALASVWSSALATNIGTTNTSVASGTYGLSALQVLIAAIQTDLDNGTDGLGALKALIDAIPTTMVGTDNAALATALEDAMQKATDPAYSQDTDSQEAIREAVDAAQVDIDHLIDVSMHETYVFPAATNLDCVLTAHADANTYSAWTEVVDSGATALSSVFASNAGHMTALVVEDTNTASTRYMFQIAYGAAKTHITEMRILSETNQIGVAQVPRIRGVHIPAGETIYYRAMCETAGSKTANAYFRYFLES